MGYGDLKVIELIENWLSGLGFNTEVQKIPGWDNKANLTATLDQGPTGLVLADHTDTVPFDQGRWRQDLSYLPGRKDGFVAWVLPI